MSPKNKTLETAADGSVASADWLADIRGDVANTIEEIGQALGLLREATDDMERGNNRGAHMSAQDAREIIAKLECTFSTLGARLSRHLHIEDDDSGECMDCGSALEVVRPGKHQCPQCG